MTDTIDLLALEIDELIEDSQTKLTRARDDYNFIAAAVHAAQLADQVRIRAVIASYATDD